VKSIIEYLESIVFVNTALTVLSLCSVMNNDNGVDAIVRPARSRFRKALRLFVVTEMVNAGFVMSVLWLFSFPGLRGIILNPLSFFLDTFGLLSLCSIVFVSNKFSLVPTPKGAKALGVELLEAEVDASGDKREGLEYVIGYVRTHYRKPEPLIRSFLTHMALRDDEAGSRAREMLDRLAPP
jgi:hypothetical protein